MKKWGLWVGMVFLGIGLIVSGCAPKPTAELEKAQKALQEAKDVGAPQLAPADYSAAENKLNEGKKLMDEVQYSKAKTALDESAQLSALAKQKALASKQTPASAHAPAAAVSAPVAEKKVVTPAPAPKSDSMEYTVVKGDCLWNISKMTDVYGNAHRWPLLYDNNKDQIKNPNLIYPKQVLKVKKDVSEDEIKAAEKKANK